MQRENGEMTVRKAVSVPDGVITIAEHQPGPMDRARYDGIRTDMLARFAAVRAEMDKVALFDPAKHHLLGTSGTVTTLAGIALGLPRYNRAKVDASWHESASILKVAEDIATADHAERAKLGCVGPERAELIVPGCAIFSAIHAHWPCAELRVADRGLREGMLREMIKLVYPKKPLFPPSWRMVICIPSSISMYFCSSPLLVPLWYRPKYAVMMCYLANS